MLNVVTLKSPKLSLSDHLRAIADDIDNDPDAPDFAVLVDGNDKVYGLGGENMTDDKVLYRSVFLLDRGKYEIHRIIDLNIEDDLDS